LLSFVIIIVNTCGFLEGKKIDFSEVFTSENKAKLLGLRF